MKVYLKLSVFFGTTLLFALVILFNACQKTEFGAKNKKFDVAEAKEWWYGKFRKSDKYSKQPDVTSPLYPGFGFSVKKFPRWKKAIFYKKGDMDFIELPLVYETNSILLPGMAHIENTLEGDRIARAALRRLLIIKEPDNDIAVRIVTLVPSAKYAKSNNYDLTHISVNSIPNDFDGYFFVGGWDESLKNVFQIKSGKFYRHLNIIRGKGFTTQNRMECEYKWVPQRIWVCVVVPSGDDLADQERCQETGYWVDSETQGNWDLQCIEIQDEQDIENCMFLGMSSSECLCMLYQTGCDNPMGDEPPPTPDEVWMDNNIIDSTNNPCVSNVLDKLKLIRETLPRLIRDMFGENGTPAFTMIFKMDNIVPVNNQMPEGGHSNFVFGSTTFDVFINSYYQNATDLGLAATILHEALHCQLYYMYNASLNNPTMLTELASTYGIIFPEVFQGNSDLEAIINGLNPAQHQAIIDLFSTHLSNALYQFAISQGIQISKDECEDLAWTGAFDSKAFTSMDFNHKQRILNAVNAEKDPYGENANVNSQQAKGDPCD